MPDSEMAPLIQLEVGGSAPVLRYDIPEPTSYEGKNFVELEFDEDIFTNEALAMPSKGEADQLRSLSRADVRRAVEGYLTSGVSRLAALPNLPLGVRPGSMISAGAVLAAPGEPPPPPLPPEPQPPPPVPPGSIGDALVEGMVALLEDGWRLVEEEGIDGESSLTPVPPIPEDPDPHLYLVESLRLTSFLGDHGAGRIVKTFTLLPGERTKISVKTFRQVESTRKSASSVLDSLTRESASELEESLLSEQSDQRSFQKTTEYYAEAKASARWGWGSAKVKAGAKASTNAAREESVKNVSNATQKHSSRSSAKREVEINTSYEVTEKVGEELSTEREIENINLSRTLNFVFRQMNQEFTTFLHLTDVRVAFFNGDPKSRREVPLSSIDSLLEAIVEPAKRDTVRDVVLEQLSAVRDRDGSPVDVVKPVEITPGDEYRLFDPDLKAAYVDDSGRAYEVPGVLLKVDRHVMRTEGVMVEALLGNGPALDSYAAQLQKLEVERRGALVAKDRAFSAQLELVNQVITDGDETKAGIAERLACRCNCGRVSHSEQSEQPAEQ